MKVYVSVDGKWSEHGFNGSRSVTSVAGEPKSDRRTWTNNAKRNVVDSVGESFKKEFPHETGTLSSNERLGFPAAYSPDRLSFVGAVIAVDASAPKGINWRALQVPKALSLRADAVRVRLYSLAGFSIYTLAWKPDSKRFAVVERNYDRTPRSPLAVIATDSGIVYSDVVVSVYEGAGMLVCRSLIASKTPDSSVVVDWDRGAD